MLTECNKNLRNYLHLWLSLRHITQSTCYSPILITQKRKKVMNRKYQDFLFRQHLNWRGKSEGKMMECVCGRLGGGGFRRGISGPLSQKTNSTLFDLGVVSNPLKTKATSAQTFICKLRHRLVGTSALKIMNNNASRSG